MKACVQRGYVAVLHLSKGADDGFYIYAKERSIPLAWKEGLRGLGEIQRPADRWCRGWPPTYIEAVAEAGFSTMLLPGPVSHAARRAWGFAAKG
jgi:hypothetical protein